MRKKNILLILVLVFTFFITEVHAKNIIRAYRYDEKNENTKCITGDEETCKETTCYENMEKNSCPPGTIIDYKVNNQRAVRFYVLHDDGETMTLQQRENTITNVAWYKEEKNNTKGPVILLEELKKATADWSNVKDHTLGDNIYTGCDSNSCSVMTYQLLIKTMRVRMITKQESMELGCTQAIKTCPIWLHNYLVSSTSFGGTVNSSSSSSYWTMTADSSTESKAWWIYCDASEYTVDSDSIGGARAVIVINKEPKEIIKNNNKNDSQVVHIEDTLKKVYLIYFVGGILLALGVFILLKNFIKKSNIK